MNGNNIEESINETFHDSSLDAKNHLIKSFSYLEKNNSEFMTELLQILCQIKREHSNFDIEFSKGATNQFDGDKISLIRQNYLILIHEIAHAMHYYYNEYDVPQLFNALRERISSNPQIIENSSDYIHVLDERIKRITNLAYDTNISDEEYDKMLIEQKCYLEMKDFIDAFFKGKTGSGHGEAYYFGDDDNKKSFSEMFATFISICSFDSSGKLKDELKGCMGDFVIELFEQLYAEIKQHYLVDIKRK